MTTNHTAWHGALADLEQSVIGGVLVDPSALTQIDHLEPGHFRDLRARSVFTAMRNLEAAGKPIDTVTVEAELARCGTADAVGGFGYLGECTIRVPTVSNVVEYARLVRDAALARDVRLALDRVLHAGESSGAELLSMAHAAISMLDAEQPSDAILIGDLTKRRVKQLEQIAADRASGLRTMTGYPTGIATLDEKIGGWQSRILSLVAARPGMGKSSAGLATADACSAAGFGVHLFSLEDTDDAYADRAMSRESDVPAESMRNASLSSIQMRDLGAAMGRIHKRKWLVDGRSGISAEEIVRSVRKHKRANGTRVVIVDYIQLIAKPRGLSSHDALTHIVTVLADAAKHDDMAYVVMSQLNRGVEQRNDKRPMMSDLRESGSLEERAKCVVGIYRGSYYDAEPRQGVDWDPRWPGRSVPPSRDDFARQVQLLVLKNNNGRTGSAWATFNGPTTRIS